MVEWEPSNEDLLPDSDGEMGGSSDGGDEDDEGEEMDLGSL